MFWSGSFTMTMRKEIKPGVMIKGYGGTFDDHINILLTVQSLMIVIISKKVYTLIKVQLKYMFFISCELISNAFINF